MHSAVPVEKQKIQRLQTLDFCKCNGIYKHMMMLARVFQLTRKPTSKVYAYNCTVHLTRLDGRNLRVSPAR